MAELMKGYPLCGNRIKTKGPSVLKREGHLESSKPRSTSPDYRPFTDCAFFMLETKCKKGKTVS